MTDESRAPKITRLLGEVRTGREGAVEELLPLVYRELQALAVSEFQRERSDHTLQPTALAHEAWLRIAGDLDDVSSRRQFFGIAARAMRQVLIDHARRRNSQKRGGAKERITLDTSLAAETRDVDVLALDEALQQLAEVNPRHARIVELRAFVGMTIEEVAEVLDVSRQTVSSDWLMAKAWLRCRIES